jgi:hypothetical protein
MTGHGGTITNNCGELMKGNGVIMIVNGPHIATIGIGGKDTFECGLNGIDGIETKKAF